MTLVKELIRNLDSKIRLPGFVRFMRRNPSNSSMMSVRITSAGVECLVTSSLEGLSRYGPDQPALWVGARHIRDRRPGLHASDAAARSGRRSFGEHRDRRPIGDRLYAVVRDQFADTHGCHRRACAAPAARSLDDGVRGCELLRLR